MAIVILGGLVTSTVMSLLLAPALIWRYLRWSPAPGEGGPGAGTSQGIEAR
jgi:hypothetical protein